MKYKAIIFDFDDTLVESRLQKWAQHKHVAKNFYDIDLIDEEIQAHWGKPMNELITILYKNSDSVENMNIALNLTTKDFLKELFEGSTEMITALVDQRVEVGIVSAANTNHIMEDLIRFNFPYDKFFAIQGSDKVSVHKPDPRVFDQLLQVLSDKGIQKNEVLYVGDSLDDFQAARGAGIDFVGVVTGLYSMEDFKNKGVEVVLSRITELPHFL